MLVLSRKRSESIVIDTPKGQVVVKVCKIDQSRVKLAIEAPLEIVVRRGELKPKPEAA